MNYQFSIKVEKADNLNNEQNEFCEEMLSTYTKIFGIEKLDDTTYIRPTKNNQDFGMAIEFACQLSRYKLAFKRISFIDKLGAYEKMMV